MRSCSVRVLLLHHQDRLSSPPGRRLPSRTPAACRRGPPAPGPRSAASTRAACAATSRPAVRSRQPGSLLRQPMSRISSRCSDVKCPRPRWSCRRRERRDACSSRSVVINAAVRLASLAAPHAHPDVRSTRGRSRPPPAPGRPSRAPPCRMTWMPGNRHFSHPTRLAECHNLTRQDGNPDPPPCPAFLFPSRGRVLRPPAGLQAWDGFQLQVTFVHPWTVLALRSTALRSPVAS